jgi:hypothetical protein
MAIIGNVDYDGAVREIGEVQAAAAKLGLIPDVLRNPTCQGCRARLRDAQDRDAGANHARINTLALGSRSMCAPTRW